ncbi:MAG: hypothetical protein WBK51_02980 [Polaromonas sp.]
MTLVDWGAVALVVLALLGMASFAHRRRKIKRQHHDNAATQLQQTADKNPYKISYVPSDMEWSGSISGAMPLKTLTYKQYECLEDARYGFKVVGVTPTERKKEQPHKTRAHGLKTVASLARHGFLIPDGTDGYVITDHGLNALEVCDVRY